MPDLSNDVFARFRELISLQLWELGAVKTNLVQPFRLVSGNFSPIYVNCRELISSPSFVDIFVAFTRQAIERLNIEAGVVAGGETAGIPFASFVAHAMGRPMIYVRKQPKEHGIANLIEGLLPSRSSVLLIEDLITDARSKLAFVRAIEAAGSEVKTVLVVIDRLQGGQQALESEGIRLISATDIDVTLHVGRQAGLLSDDDFGVIKEYQCSPENWHKERGLSFN